MSEFKCTYCPRTFASRNGLSKHMAKCVLIAEAEEHLIDNVTVNQPIQIRSSSISTKNIPHKSFDFVANKSESVSSTKKFSIKDIKFRNVSKLTKLNRNSSNLNLDSTEAGPSVVANSEILTSDLGNMSFEFDTNNIVSNYSEFNSTTHLLEPILHDNQESPNNLLNNSSYTDYIQNSSDDDEIDQKHDGFPNEAYADLMVLVTKYNLSNAAGNAIISFFNKHSNHSKSPLPKNIKQGKEFMNNIKSNLSYEKTKVLEFDNTEYFLYHLPIMSCIKNILNIPDMAENLEFEYKELYKTTKVYITFNIICKYNIYFVLY